MKPYELLTLVLNRIEENINEELDIDELAASFAISSVHLQRIFKFAFGLPLAKYIRSRNTDEVRKGSELHITAFPYDMVNYINETDEQKNVIMPVIVPLQGTLY